MIDPFNITDYSRNEYELQEFLIFAISVAGKTASQVSIALEEFLEPCRKMDLLPIDLIAYYIRNNILMDKLKQSRLGKHTLLHKALTDFYNAKLNLFNCTIEQLESIHGIGPKTARFFILHSRPAADVAVLDVHVLRYIRDGLGYNKAPKATPSNSKLYKELEQIFIKDAKSKNKTVAQWDLDVWKMYARNI